jgi:peroxiredoxin
MTILAGDTLAIDFELEDIHGERVRLSAFQGGRNVVLVFLRGFL